MSELNNLAEAINNLSAAIREQTKAMFPPQQEEPPYRCAECGSPLWEPGGQAEAFKKCRDCGTIGDLIES